MGVGEGPGSNEVRLGAPFVGAAGEELTAMLNDAGILRSEVYLTNVSRFQPPNNDIDAFIKPIPKVRKKLDELLREGFVQFRNKMVKPFIAEHIGHLEKEIDNVRPNVIVLFGGTPLWALTGEEGITKWRGSLLPITVLGRQYKAVAVLHPAYILRSWSDRADTVQDLRRVQVESLSPEYKERAWSFSVRPAFREVMERLEWLLAHPSFLCADIETRKRHIACYGLAWSPTEALCIPLMSVESQEGYWSRDEELAIVRLLLKVLQASWIIGQNFLYDAYYTALWMRTLLRPWFDTMLAQNVAFPGRPKALGYLASLYCESFRYWKDDGREWHTKMPEERFWTYNCMDCCYNYEAAFVLDKIITARDVRGPFQRQMALFTPVLRTMLRGMKRNTEGIAEADRELERALATREKRLEIMFGHYVNPRSPKQLVTLFYEDMEVKPIKDRKTGKPTLNEAAMLQIAQAHPILAPATKCIEEARSINVLRSTFINTEGPKNRFYYSYNPAGTETFRFSGSTNPIGWGTNPQNVPKYEEDEEYPTDVNVRKLFLPDPGMILVEWDLSKADLHVVAWEADDDDLRSQLAQGINVYREGAKVVKLPYTKAKSFIHGTDYAGSARTMAINCKMTVKASEYAQNLWFAAHPGIRLWHRRIEDQLLKTHEVSNRLGYKRFYFDRVEGVLPQALAWIPQSTVGNVINTAFLRITAAWPEIEVLLQTHDSLTTQMPIHYARTLVPKVTKLFAVIVPYPKPLVIPVDTKASLTSWGELVKWHEIEPLIPK